MKTWKKVLIGLGGALLLLIVVGIVVHQSNKGIVTVQTGKAAKQDADAKAPKKEEATTPAKKDAEPGAKSETKSAASPAPAKPKPEKITWAETVSTWRETQTVDNVDLCRSIVLSRKIEG